MPLIGTRGVASARGFGFLAGASGPTYIDATVTGGTVAILGDFRVATFNGSGSFTVNSVGSGSVESNVVEYLVVGGGGSGGNLSGGGGGGGQVRSASGLAVTAQTYTVSVGAGGPLGGFSTPGGNGSPSVFPSITSAGGGYAASETYAAFSGSGTGGGGSSANLNFLGGAGTIFSGGRGNRASMSGPGKDTYIRQGAGGGGGSGGGGADGEASFFPSVAKGGNGGGGTVSSITGVSTGYGGGGGGSMTFAGPVPSTFSVGIGTAGGGDGSSSTFPNAGAINSGGGGGGVQSSSQGSQGGSGIVVIKWRFQ